MTESPSKLIVYFLSDSRADRILWLLEELEVEYEVKYFRRTAGYTAPKELKEIHPLGKSPVIKHDDITVAESGTIVEYLLKTFDKEKKFSTFTSTKNELQNSYFSHYSEGTFMPLLVSQIIYQKSPARAPWFIRPVASAFNNGVLDSYIYPQINTNLQFMEGELAKSPSGWYAGEAGPTAADFMMSFPINALTKGSRGDSLKMGPSIERFHALMTARPAWKRAMEREDLELEKFRAESEQKSQPKL